MAFPSSAGSVSPIRGVQGTMRRDFDISKRMGPGAFKHRGALHLRFSEGFLVHTSSVLGFCERVAFALQSRRYVQIVDCAMRLAAAYDLGRAATLRRARSPI
jgi:hypothetical protein